MTSRQLPGWLRDAVAPLAEVLPEDHRQRAADGTAGAAAAPSAPSTPSDATPGTDARKADTAAASPQQQAKAEPGPAPALDEARIRAIVRDELDRHERKPAPAVGGIAHTGWTMLGYVFGFLGGVGGAGLFLLVMGFCFVYFSVSFPRVQAWFAELVPKAGKSRTLDLLARMDQVVSGFVRGRIIVAGLVGLIYALGWTLVGVPYGFLLGLAVGLCSLIPYLAAIGLPMAWLLLVVELVGAQERGGMYFIGEGGGAAISWWRVLLFPALVNVVAQLLEDYVLNPAIQGKATNLHPATIMIAVIAGGALAGLYGMLLAIPVAACLKILMDESIMPHIRQWLAGRREDPLPESRST
jgi:predicted PurR-regulated permease PerM